MKSKIVAMLIASFPLVAFAEVPLAQKTWVNPLFKVYPPVGEGPFVELKDGSLMIVRGNATATSKDNGKTWSELRPIYEGDKPGIPQQGTMLKTREGAIVLVYMDQSTFYWEWDDSTGEPNGEPRMDVWAIRSLDDGKTWIDRQLIFKGYCGALIDIIQTRSGHIVVPVQRYIADPARHGTCTYVSADNGKTWRRSNIVDMGGVGAHDGAFEAAQGRAAVHAAAYGVGPVLGGLLLGQGAFLAADRAGTEHHPHQQLTRLYDAAGQRPYRAGVEFAACRRKAPTFGGVLSRDREAFAGTMQSETHLQHGHPRRLSPIRREEV